MKDGLIGLLNLLIIKIMGSGDFLTFCSLFHIRTQPSNLISLISMSFTQVYTNILLPFVESYKAAKNEKNRALVIKNAADVVSKSRHLLEDQGVNLPKDLKTVCHFSFSILLHCYSLVQAITRYIKEFTKKETTEELGDQKPTKIKQVYTIRDVINQNYQALVQAEIPYQQSDKEYIGSYQRAVTTVHKNMTKKDLEEAEELVELWNRKGAPFDVQLK